MLYRLTPLAVLLAFVPTTVTAQTAPAGAPQSNENRTVVVTGVRLSDLKKALKECLDRKCPPDQDIAATLALAETQFVDGNYYNARSTLQASISRNKRYAKGYPVPVSDLLRANSRVAAHLGDGDSYRIGTIDTLGALKAGLPDSDYRVLGARIEMGDMYARFDRLEDAVDEYTFVEKEAKKVGLYNVQGMARLRIVALYTQLGAALPGQFKAEARKSAAALIADPDPHMKPFGQAARVLLARLEAKSGDTSAIDTLIEDYRATGGGTIPVLLYSPPIDVAGATARGNVNGVAGVSGNGMGTMLADTSMQRVARFNYDGEWVDIGFWVTPDGRVSDADVLRGGKGSDKGYYWVKSILASINGRRYAPLKMEASQPGVLRVERYTLTSRLTTYTGSRMQVREPSPQIEMLDLSIDPPTAPAGN